MDGVVLDSVAPGACDGECARLVGVRRGGMENEGCVASANMLTASTVDSTGETEVAWLTSMSSCPADNGLGEEELRSFFSGGCVPLGETAVCVGGGEGGGVGSRTKGWQTRQGTLDGAAETKFSQHCSTLVAKSITDNQYWDRVRGEVVRRCVVSPWAPQAVTASPCPSGTRDKTSKGSRLKSSIVWKNFCVASLKVAGAREKGMHAAIFSGLRLLGGLQQALRYSWVLYPSSGGWGGAGPVKHHLQGTVTASVRAAPAHLLAGPCQGDWLGH